MTALSPDAVPRLPRGVRLRRDAARDRWVLLAPERVLELDPIAVEVVRRCNGVDTVAAIVDDLAAVFDADRARIDADVSAMLSGLLDKKAIAL